MNFDFKNKTVFLTGGQRGIGLCIKKTFEELGATVIAPSIEELDLLSRESTKKYAEKFNKNKIVNNDNKTKIPSKICELTQLCTVSIHSFLTKHCTLQEPFWNFIRNCAIFRVKNND